MNKRVSSLYLLLMLGFLSAGLGLFGAQSALPTDDLSLDLFTELEVVPGSEEEVVAEIELPPTPAGQEAPIIFPLDIPHIGRVILTGKMDLEKMEFSLSGKPAKESYELGGLKIEKPSITLSNKAGLQMEATVSFFNKKIARLAIESFNPLEKRMVLSLGLPSPLTIPITPWKSIQTEALYLTLSPTEKKVSTKIYLSPNKQDEIEIGFGVEAEIKNPNPLEIATNPDGSTELSPIEQPEKQLSAEEQDKRSFVQISFANFRLSALLDELKNTQFDNIVLQKGSVKVTQPFTQNANRVVTINGLVDFSKLKLDLPGELSNLTLNGVLDKKNGTKFSVKVNNEVPLIPGFLQVKNASIEFTSIPADPTTNRAKETLLALNGGVSVKFPDPVGELNTQISSTLKNGKFETFEGKLNKSFEFKNVVTISEASIRYIRATNMLELVGKSRVLDQFDIEARLQTFEETTGPDKGKRVLAFSGKVAPGKTLKPFADIPGINSIPLAKTMEIGDLEFSLDTNQNFKISGQAKIGNFPAKATLIKTQTAVVVKVAPGEGWKLTDSISGLRGTPFEKLDYGNINLAIASADYEDPETKLKIPQGLSFIAGMSLSSGIFANARSLVGAGSADQLFVSGSVNSMGLGLTISIPTIVNLGGGTFMENIYLMAQYQAPSTLTMAIKTKIRTRLPKQTEDTLFYGQFDLNIDPKSPGVTIKGTMLGLWKNPLGIPGIAIGDVAFELGAALLPAPPFIRPSSVGFTGKVEIGDKKIMVATKISDKGDIVLQGALDGKLSLDDLLTVPRKLGANIPNIFPDISIQDINLKVATLDTTIGEIPFHQGITVKGKLNFLGAYALVDITVDKSGIRALGAMSEVKLGKFLTISRAQFGQKDYGSTVNGPIIELTLNLKKQEFFMSGLMELLGSKNQTEVYLGREGFRFMTEASFMGSTTRLSGISSGRGSDIDFKIKGEMENKFFEYVHDQVIKGIASFQKKAAEDIGKAQREVDKLNSDITNLGRQVASRNEKINALKKVIADKTANAKKDVSGAYSKVNNELNKVNSLKNQINELERKLKAEYEFNSATSDLFIPSYKISPHDPVRLAHFDDWKDDIALYQAMSCQAAAYPELCWNPFTKAAWQQVGKGFEQMGKEISKAANVVGKEIKKAAEEVGKGIKTAAEETYKGMKYVGEKASYAVQLGGLYTALGVATAALETAKGVLHVTEKAAFDPSSIKEAAEITKEGIELAALEVARQTLIGSRETAKGVLEGAKQTAFGLGEAAKFSARQIAAGADLFTIKRATIEASLNDMFTKGLFPTITMDAKVFGKDMYNLKLQLDFKRPDRFVTDILKIIGKLFS